MKFIVRCLVTLPLAVLWVCIIPMTMLFDFCFALGAWLNDNEERTLFILFKNEFSDDLRTFPSPVKLWRRV